MNGYKDIAAVMMTMDRSPRPNYLPRTLENFQRSGGFRSPRLHSLGLANSRADNWLALALERAPADVQFAVDTPLEDREACRNAAAALDLGVLAGTPWVLFMEDDLDFCGDFMDSVGRWLDDHATDAHHVFTFGCAYPQIDARAKWGLWTWEYAVKMFYGTQCIALRREDAKSLANYWRTNPIVCDVYSPSAYDLMLQDWHRQEFPEQQFLLASAPSFVQHIGRASVATGKKETHVFTSWPGKFWTYDKEVIRA